MASKTSKWADNRQATNFECTLTPCDLNCGFLLTSSDVYYTNQDFQTSKWADNRQATNFECTLTPCDLNCGFLLTNSDVYYANQDFQREATKSYGTMQITHNPLIDSPRWLQFDEYKVQIMQALLSDILEGIERFNYLKQVCLSDEAIFHTSGKVNRHNVRIFGSEN
ncbi:hypothetical protein ANN_14441 [Periplaneta americana]|uniref:Uncharacterized protein n=1 Tax=Periplaneta americana TaxID=6978 RepID=A0ABQ8SXP1_PERAM|nr:hypothetical protein ANN_14441 [Periplaneta americana]